VDIQDYGRNRTDERTQALSHRLPRGRSERGAAFLRHGARLFGGAERRFAGQVGEQATMFFLDPAGNALEFKAFNDLSRLFAK
jgi:extradiol dioxygenase family protein